MQASPQAAPAQIQATAARQPDAQVQIDALQKQLSDPQQMVTVSGSDPSDAKQAK